MQRSVNMRGERDPFIINNGELTMLTCNFFIKYREVMSGRQTSYISEFRYFFTEGGTERENLKTARVRYGWTSPTHELREASGLAHYLLAWLQIKMIRIRKDDFHTERAQLFGENPFYTTLGADWCKGRGMNNAMRRRQNANPSAAPRRSLLYLKLHSAHNKLFYRILN